MDLLLLVGAGCFGGLVGWYVYYINRYRKGDVGLGDIATVLGVIGGAAVPKIFSDNSAVFGAYGIGLAIGFFGYLLNLIVLVKVSKNFGVDWFLDGRRTRPEEPVYIPDGITPTFRPEFALRTESALVSNNVPLPASAAAMIIDACEAEWPADSGDCSAFVRDVAASFNVTLKGSANDIVNDIQLQAGGWRRLKSGTEAAQAAGTGNLVIAGLKGSEQSEPAAHGHVAVIVAGPIAQGKYPSAYWGKLGSVGEKNKTINWAWRRDDRDRVCYGAMSVISS